MGRRDISGVDFSAYHLAGVERASSWRPAFWRVNARGICNDASRLSIINLEPNELIWQVYEVIDDR